MKKSELRLLIGEIVLQHFDKSSRGGDFNDNAPQDIQQELFDEFVNSTYQGFIENPHWVANLHLATEEDIKKYLEDKFKNARGY